MALTSCTDFAVHSNSPSRKYHYPGLDQTHRTADHDPAPRITVSALPTALWISQ